MKSYRYYPHFTDEELGQKDFNFPKVEAEVDSVSAPT